MCTPWCSYAPTNLSTLVPATEPLQLFMRTAPDVCPRESRHFWVLSVTQDQSIAAMQIKTTCGAYFPIDRLDR
jgi:hypothetical protein